MSVTRYFQVPAEPLEIVDINTGEPLADKLPVARVMRDIVNGVLVAQKLDVLHCCELRGKLQPGSVAELTEEEHGALKEEIKLCSAMSWQVKASPEVVAVLRGLVDAPSVRPGPAAEPAP